jgi:hypothetical protein
LRNIVGVIIAALLVLGVLGSGLGWLFYGMYSEAEEVRLEEKRLRGLAEVALKSAEEARRGAEEAKLRAEAQRARADDVAQQALKSLEQLQNVTTTLRAAAATTPDRADVQGTLNQAQTSIEAQREKLVSAGASSVPADVGRYRVFLHDGGGDAALASRIAENLRNLGFRASSDSYIDPVGGPGVEYFNDEDRNGAVSVALAVNSMLPADLKPLRPRRQTVDNPPGFLGVWLFEDLATVDAATWTAGPPSVGWCYQREEKAFSQAMRFLVRCFSSQDYCRDFRATDRGVKTPCILVRGLSRTGWKPQQGVVAKKGDDASVSWFQYSPTVMRSPFPAFADE